MTSVPALSPTTAVSTLTASTPPAPTDVSAALATQETDLFVKVGHVYFICRSVTARLMT